MPYIGKQLVRGQNRKLDDISSGFNGSQTTFTLQVASQNVTVGSALQLWISVGGVIQNPLTDFTIAGNQITFTTAPAASLDFFGVIQGDVTDTNTPGDATVTTSKLATGLTVNLADGSAATSSLQLGGTDSGLFSSAADKVNVTTGGAERLEIGSSEVVFNDPSNDVDFRVESDSNTHMLFVEAGINRVGIGTSSPSSPLTVQADSSTNGIAVFGRSADDISTTLFFENDGTTQIGRLQARQSYFQISGTDNTNGIFIDNAGRVGIGDSSPSNALNVVGIADFDGIAGNTMSRLRIQPDESTKTAFLDARTASGNSQFAIKTGPAGGSTERFRVDGSGRLLVGTTSAVDSGATSSLQVVNTSTAIIALGRDDSSISAGNDLGAIRFYGNDGGSYQMCAEVIAEADGDHANNDKPSRLVFSTTADSGSSPTERMRIDSSGKIGINTTSPGCQTGGIHAVHDATQGTPSFTGAEVGIFQRNFNGSQDCAVSIVSGNNASSTINFGDADDVNPGIIEYLNGSNAMRFSTNAAERMRIDSGGKLLIGKSSARTNFLNSSFTAFLQVEGTGHDDSAVSIVRNSNNGGSPYLNIGKSRGSSVNGNTVVQSGDGLGVISFQGADGSEMVEAATIIAQVDGTPGANDMPGRLAFYTTANGASSPTERMRISNVGKFTAPTIYSLTTTGGGPVYVEADGDLLRYTSSLKYKTDVETIEDARADAILNCRPVWYRSKCENDIKTEGSEKSDWGWYGFIAEEVAEIEPRLVNWATKDGVEQEDGSVESVERDPADYEAEGVRYDNFVPLLLNLVKRQQAAIETLEAKVAALEAK